MLKLNITEEQALELADMLVNPGKEPPTDEDLLSAVGEGRPAQQVGWLLRFSGFSLRESQLAMQRAVSNKVLRHDGDWKLLPVK